MVLFREVPSDRHVEVRSGPQQDALTREGRIPKKLHDEKESRVVGLKEPRMRLFMEVGNKAGAEWGARLELCTHH